MKEGKQYLIFRLLSGILLTAVAWGCQNEETLSPEVNTSMPLRVQVADISYTSSEPKNSGILTRTEENGYNTVFTEGDSIGVYVSRERDVVPYRNLCFVLTNIDGKLVWKNPDDISLWYEGKNGRYYAYYPYQSKEPEILPTNSDDVIYFRPLIREWQVSFDQSTYEKYTASDLMVCRGILDACTHTLTFTFSHQMTLLEIDLSGLSDPTEIIFHSFVPYQSDASGKKYRYVVRHDETGFEKDLSLTYTYKGITKDYIFTGIQRLGRGKCKTYYLKE